MYRTFCFSVAVRGIALTFHMNRSFAQEHAIHSAKYALTLSWACAQCPRGPVRQIHTSGRSPAAWLGPNSKQRLQKQGNSSRENAFWRRANLHFFPLKKLWQKSDSEMYWRDQLTGQFSSSEYDGRAAVQPTKRGTDLRLHISRGHQGPTTSQISQISQKALGNHENQWFFIDFR